ncbi:Uncharacterized protein DAT39_010491, partial [Clarias magur]
MTSTQSADVAVTSSADDSDKEDGDSEAGSSTVSKRSTQPTKAATIQRSSSPTEAALSKILKKAAEVHNVHKQTAQPHHDEMGSRRAMAEMIYHEARPMGADTAIFQTLMHFKT